MDIKKDLLKYKRGWKSGLPETPCGKGSTLERTAEQRKWIEDIIKKYNIKTISDIGAGDLNWIKHIELPEDVMYTGYDLVPRDDSIKEFNLITSIPPKSDLIMCVWVLNHLTEEDALIAFDNLRKSGSKYLMITYTEKWQQHYISDLEYLERLYLLDKTLSDIRLLEFAPSRSVLRCTTQRHWG